MGQAPSVHGLKGGSGRNSPFCTPAVSCRKLQVLRGPSRKVQPTHRLAYAADPDEGFELNRAERVEHGTAGRAAERSVLEPGQVRNLLDRLADGPERDCTPRSLEPDGRPCVPGKPKAFNGLKILEVHSFCVLVVFIQCGGHWHPPPLEDPWLLEDPHFFTYRRPGPDEGVQMGFMTGACKCSAPTSGPTGWV